MPKLPGFFETSLWMFIACVTALCVFIWLFVMGNRNYTVDDTESHAEQFGGVIKEGHGGMTVFLWISFALILGWAVYYLVVNWSQFAVILALRNLLS